MALLDPLGMAKNSAIVCSPAPIAASTGILPSLSLTDNSAPASTRARHDEYLPHLAALCRAVSPFWSAALMSNLWFVGRKASAGSPPIHLSISQSSFPPPSMHACLIHASIPPSLWLCTRDCPFRNSALKTLPNAATRIQPFWARQVEALLRLLQL